LKNFFSLSNPGQTLTFNEVVLPTATVVTNQYTGLGVPFSPLVFYSPHTGFPGIVGYDVGNFTFSGNLVDPTTSSHFDSSSLSVTSACSATAGGASSASRSAFPLPVRQERTAA
jgi:hypothetical protein